MRHIAAFVLFKSQRVNFLSKYLLACILLLSFTFANAAQVTPFDSADEGRLFTLQGSNTIGARLAPAWAKSFLEAKGAKGIMVEALPQLNEYRIKGRNGARAVFIDVNAHGSSTGFQGLKTNMADIALSSRSIKDKEVSALNNLGDMRSAQSEHVVAIDGLAVIIHPNNELAKLPVNVIGQIFSGQITNWEILGGPNRTINVYARDDQSGTYDTFKNLVLGKQLALIPTAKRFESNDELSDRVASDIDGIGFVGLASVRQAKALAVSEGNTTALKPEIMYVATEDYPLSRRLYMYTGQSGNKPLVTEFIHFAQDLDGQKIVEEIGFISQNPKSLTVELATGPAQYQALSKYARRLSLNFRFQSGRADLDNKALQDVQRLARFMKMYANKNMNIQLVGFSNVESTEKRAQVLSRLRATAVKSALYRYDIRTDSVMGFGDTLRVADATGSSSVKNERVEVWIYPSTAAAAVEKVRKGDLTAKILRSIAPVIATQ
ncbi:substrate-binding domain-containing protein [Marinagarivorans algicola]|uniref:substrate-binding domain-containing protein n=1 Tax=Marinagarivorans algicola TaxID=1513270 RepID=UPI0006B4DD29|nr:substrate-binding domain-containing protein [Marinagarivorans algicola]